MEVTEKDERPPREHLIVPRGEPFSEATSGKGKTDEAPQNFP